MIFWAAASVTRWVPPGCLGPSGSTCVAIHSHHEIRPTIDSFSDSLMQNLMKGYIARERGFVVLSKSGAFPGTGV